MQENGLEEKTVSSVMEDHNEFDSLPLGNTYEAEYIVYGIEDEAEDDQTYDKEKSMDEATLSMDSTLRPSVGEPPDLELKTLPEPLEYAFLEEGSKLPVIISTNIAVEQKKKRSC